MGEYAESLPPLSVVKVARAEDCQACPDLFTPSDALDMAKRAAWQADVRGDGMRTLLKLCRSCYGDGKWIPGPFVNPLR